MSPTQIGPSAWESPEPSDSPAGSRAFENSPFTQILEAVPYGLFVLAASGMPIYANSRAREILGKGIPDDANHETLAEAYSVYLAGTETRYPEERMPIIRALSGETSTVSDMEIRLPGGSVYLEVSGAPVLDVNRRVKYAVAAFHDITVTRSVEATLQLLADELATRARERSEQLESLTQSLGNAQAPGEKSEEFDPWTAGENGKLEPCANCIVLREVEQARESAALANRALTLFIANFSHELRTPLNHIMGFSDLIESKIQSGVTHDIGKHAQNIRRSGASLLETLNKIITVAEAESSELELSLEIFDIGSLLREVASKFKPLAERNRNQFELILAGELGLIQSDAARVRAALEQIVENACKHCRGGSVSISASRKGTGIDGSIEVVVGDTGRGIDPTRAALLVTGRVVPGDPIREAGLGIGIPLAVQSLRALGGSLKFVTEPGARTRFTLTLPAYTRV